MKRSILLTFLLVPWHLVSSQDIEVTIKNVKNDKGVLVIGLFNSEKTFTKHPVKSERPKAQPGTMVIRFRNVPGGEYAVSIFHDANENGALDVNFMGIPKEGFGFSNDAMGTFGPPTFNKARFTIPAANNISVTLKYF